MTALPHLPSLPSDQPNEREHRRAIARTINAMLREEGLPHRWNTVSLPGNSGQLGGANDPTFKRVQRDSSTSSNGVYAHVFAPGVLKELFFCCTLPHSYAQGSDLIAAVRWAPQTADGAVAWGLEYTIANVDGVFGATDRRDQTFSAAAALTHQVSTFATITGSGVEIGAALLLRVYRDGAAAGDTNSLSAILLGVDIYTEHDTRGSWAMLDKWAGG